ncbi:hypothetical protein JTE90_003995 [Oedothorax gibbosus]|uniref:tRNA-dihydrouridine(47) synthase [NAD(P)(+)] n=1 Tax=Oedothorax gibbosus TaxID=931172 RepID=A0AAV6UDC2_9ARAC|nr:hypothetical protein JTE90_003995 [Oedothorax gibbosus]
MEPINSTEPNSGVASIKSEFLLHDHVRELDLDFVSAKDKKRGAPTENSEGPRKKKLKGQNKHRPRNKSVPKAEKLCFKIGTEGSCPFGDTCVYSHDVDAYLSSKPTDLGPTCYLYRTFGKCPYSYSCRYGLDHIQDGKNLVLEEVYEQYKTKNLVSNFLTKDLQFALRKHNYDFKKSDKILDAYSHFLNEKATDDKAKSDSNENNVNGNSKTNEDNLNENDESSKNSLLEENAAPVLPLEKDTAAEKSNATLEKNKSIDDLLFEREIRKIDFENKLYLAPLTTVGNLPFRRICKELGADITCSEMALSLSLLQGQNSEWALIKRHHTEDIYGIQLCGFNQSILTRCCQVLSENASFDFIDINMGCPLDAIYKKGAGCGLMNRLKKLEGIVYGVSSVINVPLTLKMRTGIYANAHLADNVIERIKKLKNSVSLITLHGRSREQRYTRSADWDYIDTCTKVANPIPLFGNGDILSYEDYNLRRKETGVSGVMIARGALIKPWIFKEIKDQAHWDISSSERLDILKNFVNYGLEHWGSDSEGVEKTRRFLLEWLSFLYRYIPVGLLERPPQHINERPPAYFGRNELETLMASPSCSDWVKISEMLLGPVPEQFHFLPKHKANAYK